MQGLTQPALVIGSSPTTAVTASQVALLAADIPDPGMGQAPYTLRQLRTGFEMITYSNINHNNNCSAVTLLQKNMITNYP